MRRLERLSLKHVLVALVVLTLAGLGLWLGRPVYRQYKEHRFITQAERFMQRAEFSQAWLSARQTLALNPNNIRACRLMAELAESSRSPHTLAWRQRIATLDPNLSNRLLLASCALRFGSPPYPLAAQTLQEIGPAAQELPAFHVASAELAVRLNNTAEAERHFQEAMRLEPTNAVHSLNLAVIRLQAKEPPVVHAARAQLEALRAHPTYGIIALRSLAAHSLAGKDFPAAERFSDQVLAQSQAVFLDRVQHLNVLHATRRPELKATLSAIQLAAATNMAHVYELSSWMTTHELASDALAWLRGLPNEIRSQPTWPMAVADALTAQSDWKGLEAFLRDQKWDDQEFVRLGILARALKNQQEPEAAQANWQRAVRLAERPERMAMLSQMASGWGWESETEELLWSITRKFPEERWAFQTLHRAYYARGNTRGLRQIYAAILEQNPADWAARNNLAAVSLLLNTEPAQAHAWAREVYDKDPKNPVFISTYAFSLHVQGKSADALKLFHAIKPADLEIPAIATYYGLLLAAAGEKEKARPYLVLAEKAPALPEEKILLAEAKKSL